MRCRIVWTYVLRARVSCFVVKGDFMNKKASMMSLLIVALVALGLMAFVSLNSVTGDAIGKAIQRPSIERPSLPDSKPSVSALEYLESDVVVVSDDSSTDALRQDIIANTIVTCDVAKAMGLQEKMSQKSISICQNLLYPFI